eukprot:TRINITY_DN11337_c0_g1_i3.p1 TRINITY_DN11337_c0_g1~~TRINITY_DN11337_c0_g1_i3.p1  ORF type:complete len:124 (-),score=7.73 TRINITY_DN11337_c0_g1_i3:29-370(-)
MHTRRDGARMLELQDLLSQSGGIFSSVKGTGVLSTLQAAGSTVMEPLISVAQALMSSIMASLSTASALATQGGAGFVSMGMGFVNFLGEFVMFITLLFYYCDGTGECDCRCCC